MIFELNVNQGQNLGNEHRENKNKVNIIVQLSLVQGHGQGISLNCMTMMTLLYSVHNYRPMLRIWICLDPNYSNVPDSDPAPEF